MFGDDSAIVTGLATIDNYKFEMIGHQKGRDAKEKVKRNFGMSKPEGYRKALRVMRLAEKFNLPILTFIDTPELIRVLMQNLETKVKQLPRIYM